MKTHTAKKEAPGHYIYRSHHIRHEDTAEGPEGVLTPYWSISGKIGTAEEDFAHPLLPQLKRLADCKAWLDAFIDEDVAERRRIEKTRFRD